MIPSIRRAPLWDVPLSLAAQSGKGGGPPNAIRPQRPRALQAHLHAYRAASPQGDRGSQASKLLVNSRFRRITCDPACTCFQARLCHPTPRLWIAVSRCGAVQFRQRGTEYSILRNPMAAETDILRWHGAGAPTLASPVFAKSAPVIGAGAPVLASLSWSLPSREEKWALG